MEILDGTIFGEDAEVREYLGTHVKIADVLDPKKPWVCPVWGKKSCDESCMYRLNTTADYADGIVSVCRPIA